MFRTFTDQNPAGQIMASYLDTLSCLEKFYTTKVYSEVEKMFGRVYTHTYRGPNDFLEVFLPGRVSLELSLEDILILYTFYDSQQLNTFVSN